MSDSMFDEIKAVKVEMVNGRPRVTDEQTIADMDAEEMKAAVSDFVQSARKFRELNSHAATHAPYASLGNAWWKALEFLALADSRLKEAFCGRDRSPDSIRLFHEYRVRLLVLVPVPYRTDA